MKSNVGAYGNKDIKDNSQEVTRQNTKDQDTKESKDTKVEPKKSVVLDKDKG